MPLWAIRGQAKDNSALGLLPEGSASREARQWIAEIRKINPASQLDKDYFSPKVLKFFTDKE